MSRDRTWRQPGVLAALGAAVLFGAGTPLAKLLLEQVDPWLLAGLLYLGSGLGLSAYRWLVRSPRLRLPPGEWRWLAGAIVAGGVIGPVLLMLGLTGMPASGASLLLNAEAVFTALLAWVVFKENVDRRIALGMLAIIAGALLLSWPGKARFAGLWPAAAILGACLAWAIDNNLTRKVALADASGLAALKGLSAGTVNLSLALGMGSTMPSAFNIGAALVVGFFAYGLSLTLFVLGLRGLGTARTGAYFSVAPFLGAAIAVALGEPVTATLLAAGTLMAVGVWLHLTEVHDHWHQHEALEHEHAHVHDEHHQHPHEPGTPTDEPHTHWHRHDPLVHQHPHFPDSHHRHTH